MNIVFFGSSHFAACSLEALLNSGDKILLVVTQPDRQKGRGLELSGTVIKRMALGRRLKVYQPPNVNNRQTVEYLKGLKPDLFVAASYGQILSEEILAIPRIFSINAHASLLPKYRGASPINRAIINAETKTGVTIIKMTDQMDAGPIIRQEIIGISGGDDCVSLEDKLARAAAKALLDAVESIKDKNYKLTAQDESQASFAPRLKKEDGMIDWNKSAQEISHLTRGLLGWPGAFTYYNGKFLKIYKARVASSVLESSSSDAGRIIKVSQDGIVVAAGGGNLVIEELQVEGKKRMKSEEFIIGHKIMAGELLGGLKKNA